jgi:hypothetical protein
MEVGEAKLELEVGANWVWNILLPVLEDIKGGDGRAPSKTEDAGGVLPKNFDIFVLELARLSGFEAKLENGWVGGELIWKGFAGLLGVNPDGFAGAVKLFTLDNTEGFPKLVAPAIPEDVPKIEGVLFSFGVPEGLPKGDEVFVEMKGACPKGPGLDALLWPPEADKARPGKAFGDSCVLLGKPPSEPFKLFAEDVERVCNTVASPEDLESRSYPSSSPSETNSESALDDAGVNSRAVGFSAGLLIKPISLACRTE